MKIILLPLSSVEEHYPAGVGAWISEFRSRSPRPPNETTTLREWLCTTNNMQHWIGACRCFGDSGRRIAIAATIAAARRSVEVFESYNPKDQRIRFALKLVESFLSNPSNITRNTLWDAQADADRARYECSGGGRAARAVEMAVHIALGVQDNSHSSVIAAAMRLSEAAIDGAEGRAYELLARSASSVSGPSFTQESQIAASNHLAKARLAAQDAKTAEIAAQRADFLAALEMEENNKSS